MLLQTQSKHHRFKVVLYGYWQDICSHEIVAWSFSYVCQTRDTFVLKKGVIFTVCGQETFKIN